MEVIMQLYNKIVNSILVWLLKHYEDRILPLINQEKILEQLTTRFASHNQEELDARIQCVRDFVNETLPIMYPQYDNMAICEDGSWNYFPLTNSKLVHFNFILTQIPLFICIPGVASASWEEARLRGITRLEWETTHQDLKIIESKLPDMPTIGNSIQPRLIILRWTDPVNHMELLDRFKKFDIKE